MREAKVVGLFGGHVRECDSYDGAVPPKELILKDVPIILLFRPQEGIIDGDDIFRFDPLSRPGPWGFSQ